VIAQPQPFQHSRPVVLDEDVHCSCKTEQDVLAFLALQIERDAPLVTVDA
jgi:hypothetical protein